MKFRLALMSYLGFVIRWVLVIDWLYLVLMRQTNSFIGLPASCRTQIYLDAVFGSHSLEILINQWVLLAITLFSAYILNAEIPFIFED
jgi:CDP-diacylglycerol--serine O-phosphatidyltransferase